MRVQILESFSGYPDGEKRADFEAGTSADVNEEFGKMIIAKGHAKAAAPEKAPKQPE